MRNRVFLEWLLVAGLAIGSMLLLGGSRLTTRIDNALYDALIEQRRTVPSDLVIVAIDEPSLAAIGRWPWPRAIHAALLRRLADARPAAIGYDVLFVEPGDPAGDTALAQAMVQAATVVLPMTFSVPGPDGAPFQPQLPIPALARAARGIGHGDFASDGDGILRRVSLKAGGGARQWPHFAEQIYRLVRGHPSPAFARVAAAALPDDRFTLAPAALIPFTGAAGHHRTVSLADVLHGEVPEEMLHGHIVLVGSTASGSGDQYAVPDGAMPGVEVQANVIDSLLADHAIRPAGPWARLLFALVPLSLLLVGLLFLSPRINVAFGIVLILGTLAASTALLLGSDIWMPPAAALAGLMIVYPLWGWRRLEAANAYMLRELRHLRAEPDLVPTRSAAARDGHWYQEPIAQQMDLLHLAIDRVRDLRRFFADSLQGLPDPTLVLDRGGHVLVANRAAEELFAGIGRPLPDTGAPALEPLLRALTTTGRAPPLDGGEHEIATADGRTFVLRTAALLDAEGKPAGTIARLTDITAVRLVNRQREDALRLLTHDMRSPQAAILALLDQPPVSEPALRDRIGHYARRTLALADDFVMLARAETAAGAEEVLDLTALLVEAADDQWPLAHGRNIRIEVADAESEHLVEGERSLLARMFVNLIGNAVKYSGPGTRIACSVATEPAPAGAGSATHGCRIADQGIGIPADELERIFDPFHRSAAVGRNDPGGSGLGLTFVRTVVKRHGGSIDCASALGEGTTFTVRLPASP